MINNNNNIYEIKDLINVNSLNRFISLEINFKNTNTNRGSFFNITINTKKFNLSNYFLNETYDGLLIQDSQKRLIFKDISINYKQLEINLLISGKRFSNNSIIELIWIKGNESYTKFIFLFKIILIIYLIFSLIYLIFKFNINTIEQWSILILSIFSILYINPFYGIRFFNESKILIIFEEIIKHIYGAILIFNIQTILSLTQPWCSEILEGHGVISWIFFVMTAFFNLIPFLISLFNEIKINENPNLIYFQNVVYIIYFIYFISILYQQFKTFNKIPLNLKYRFWFIFYFNIFFIIIFIIWKLLSNFTIYLSNYNDFILTIFIFFIIQSFYSLFWSRKVIIGNWFHEEIDKEKLE